MESFLILLGLFLVLALVVFPIWAVIKIQGHHGEVELLDRRLRHQEAELRDLKSALKGIPAGAISAAAHPAAVPVPPVATPAPEPIPPVPVPAAPPAAPLTTPLPPVQTEPPVDLPPEPILLEPPLIAAMAAPVAAAPPPPERPAPRPPAPALNWEQFMGAKLFAWLGGLALFLGVAFFVKYSFEHNLVPPQVRVAIGFVVSAGLVVGGLRLDRRKYGVTAQTLVAAGIVSLYAVTFACDSIYHFAFFGPVATFLLMSLITAAAFLLAVRLDAQVVAVLGILGGFLTPILISTGHDNPVGLFGYLGILVVGLAAVALHRRWLYLVPLGAAGTILLLVGWAGTYYTPEKTGIAMVVCLAFSALFTATAEAARRLGRPSALLGPTAVALPATAFCFSLFFLGHPAVAARTGLFFTFVGLTSLCVVVLAWREKAPGLVAMAAGAGAVLMTFWAAETFTPAKGPVLMAVCLGFSVLYFAVYLLARRRGMASGAVLGAAIGLPVVALAFGFFLVGHEAPGTGPGLLFAFFFVCDALLLAIAWREERTPRLPLAAGGLVFLLLAAWTAGRLTDALLPWGLGAYLLFGALHTGFPLLLARRRPAAAPTGWTQLFPPLALLLMVVPVCRFAAVSLLIWPAMLLVDVIAIALAVATASLAGVAAVLILTLAATAVCIFQVPAGLVLAPSLLLVIGGFAVFFFAGGLWLVRRLGGRLPVAPAGPADVLGGAPGLLPGFSSLLPFLLLIMVCARLAVPDPSAVFGLGLLLVVLALGLARILAAEWLPACALAGISAVELVWHGAHFNPAAPGVPLAWYVGFYALFAAYPFLFRAAFAKATGPWATAALSGVAHFWVAYQAIKRGWPNGVLGLVPAAFVVLPFGSLLAILRSPEADPRARLNQLAWLGGVALLFITLIFPVQFDRQWLTVAWALEGAALLWLFCRVPHPGLRAAGLALLGLAFVRLALNPAVLAYHVRGPVGVFNWYLYAYGLTLASLFAGARFLAPPRERVGEVTVPPLLHGLGVILLFLLLNIEIADYFTRPGAASLAFQFSGNFARDMSYTIGWALYALGLLAAGIWRGHRSIRYAALALLSVALLKLFFHDLARLEALYRIGALFAVAVIAILASLAYQRFLPADEKPLPTEP